MLHRPVLPPPPDAALWYDESLPLKLGCTTCPELGICGGLRIAAGVFDCSSLCACARNAKRCCGVCRRDPRVFIARVNEVGGFEFETVSRCALLAARAIPEYVPIIYDGTNRCERLDGGVVALPLQRLFDRRSGTGRFDTREEMLAFFLLSPATRIVLTGVAEDRAIERWWSFADRPRLIESLRPLGIEMVTAPNYSIFTNVTRYDNLHNMKRIALTWSEFVAGGMPCALHVNGRTDTDYKRWTNFIGEREEVSIVAFEFTTGTRSPVRGAYHCDQLVALAAGVRRPLHLVLRGGRRYLRQLSAAFASVSVLDADPYMKTKYRQRARFAIGAEVKWHPSPTANGEPLDGLLRHNIDVARHSTVLRLAWLRADHGHAESGHRRSLLQSCSA